MRTCVIASALLVAALWPSWARAQSRVSVEVGGMVSAYDLDTGPAVSRGAVTAQSNVPSVAATTASSSPTPSGGIAAAEVRPSILTDSGLLFAVGFRAGKAGFGDGSTALVGGDVSVGFQHRFGPFLPFVKAMFGFNSYDKIGNLQTPHQTDLRLDAVLGSRIYVSDKLFLSASAFAGWGDRYGAALAVGGDVVQFFRRGVMP
jgi:hypothetical protein